MLKTINKFIIPIIITIMIFFINTTEVKAKTCEYVSPLTYIDENSIPMKAEMDIIYYRKESINDFADILGMKQWTAKTATVQLNSFKIIIKDDSYNYGVTYDEHEQLGNELYFYSEEIEVEKSWFKSCPKYVKIIPMSFNYSLVYDDITDEEYYNYLKEKQFNNIVNNSSALYGIAKFNVESEKKTESKYKFKDSKNTFKKFLQTTNEIILVNTSNKEKYPSSRLSKFKKELEKVEGGTGILENFPIDQSEYNEITYTEAYYNATKDKWGVYMQNDINNPKKADAKRKSYFLNWYNNVSRYIFEEDLSLFRKYFVYLYENDKTPLASDNESDKEANGEKNYNLIIKAIDAMISYEDAEVKESEYVDDNCSSLCVSSTISAQASEECKKGGPYNNCVNASKTCNSKCSYVTGDGEVCYSQCMKTELGDEAYNEYESAKKEKEKNIEDQKNSALSDIVYTLSRVDTPSFSGIEFDSEGYKVQCEDVEILHTVYMIMTIMAPILVVLFGTFDYTKSVLAADEKKILEARKKFPKRLLLLVLFILVPTIINIIIHFAGGQASLLRCIVKGA